MTQSVRAGAGRLGRLGVQLIGTTLLVLTVGLLITSTNTIDSEERLLSEQLDARGNALARLGATACAELMLGSDYPRVETIVVEIARQDPDVMYCRAEKPDGEVIRESYGPIEGGLDVERLRRYEAPVLWVRPDGDGGPPLVLGRIELGLSAKSLDALKAARTRVLLFEAAGSFVLLGVTLAFVLRRRVVRPLELLDQQAAALGEGDLDTPVQSRGGNEIGRLGQTLEGMRRNLRASYSEIRANNVELTRLGTLKDKALEDLAQALEAAQAAGKAKDEFLATMSHELRTPLNGIIGMTQMLSTTRLDAEQREFAQTAHTSAESLLVLVNDILDFSKLNAGKVELAPVRLDPRVALAEACQMFQPQAQQKGLTLVHETDERVPPFVLIDPTRLRQILLNLVGNAVKFTEKGGITVRLTSGERPAGRVELRFVVADTGVGIATTARHRLFQPFTQADGSITRRFGGTGLGLVIARRLSELMGGQVGYSSEQGRGSTFWFTVVVDAVPSGSEPPALPSAPVDAPAARLPAGLKVLLVEDNAVNQRVAVKMLERLGLTVDLASDGAQAIARHAEGGHGLILMDLSMPTMDGLEATRRIREKEAGTGGRVPILALTANAMSGDRQKCLAAGMDDYLSKPVRMEALEAKLRKFLGVGARRGARG